MLKIRVSDMSCGHCAAAIEQAVKSVDPDARVWTDLGARTASIETCADADILRGAIRDAGYRSEEADD